MESHCSMRTLCRGLSQLEDKRECTTALFGLIDADMSPRVASDATRRDEPARVDGIHVQPSATRHRVLGPRAHVRIARSLIRSASDSTRHGDRSSAWFHGTVPFERENTCYNKKCTCVFVRSSTTTRCCVGFRKLAMHVCAPHAHAPCSGEYKFSCTRRQARVVATRARVLNLKT